jgi:hypothetical protein
VTQPAEPETLFLVISRCAWLIEYYESTGVSPDVLQTFRDTMAKAIKDLEALNADKDYSSPPARRLADISRTRLSPLQLRHQYALSTVSYI